MAYFLKKTINKKGTYLQIYESYYDPERKGGAHRSHKPIGYVHELQEKGLDDPISFYKEEIKKLNQEFHNQKLEDKSRQISEESPEKLLGYFPIKNINDSLDCKKYLNLMQTATGFRFNVFDILSALVYSRIVHPCSKSKTFIEVIPKLFEKHDFSLDQLYSGLEYIGDLKQRNHISGRTIQVADKGLNCIANILHAIKNGDGYIFSKSVKKLPDTEKTWILLENDYKDVKNTNGELLYRIKECTDDFPYTYRDEDGHVKKVVLTEKRIVTYNPKLAEKQKYEINKQVEKAKKLRASEAKKTEYGDSAKYVTFTPVDKKGNETNGKIKVELNNELIEKSKELAGYNMIVTSELRMSASTL